MWRRAGISEIPSRRAISAVERPSASRWRTSHWRSVTNERAVDQPDPGPEPADGSGRDSHSEAAGVVDAHAVERCVLTSAADGETMQIDARAAGPDHQPVARTV